MQETGGYLKANWPRIKEQLQSGSYRPQPVRQVQIPKSGGGTRELGILYVALNVEVFPFGEGMGPELNRRQPEPDIPNYTWRDWGNALASGAYST